MENNIDKSFFRNIIGTVLGLSFLMGIVALGYRGHLTARLAGGFLSGEVLGMINLYFIANFVNFFTSEGGKRKIKKLAMVAAALLLALAAMSVMLMRGMLDGRALLVGFTLILMVMLIVGLKVLKR
jgi:hypothetical protein